MTIVRHWNNVAKGFACTLVAGVVWAIVGYLLHIPVWLSYAVGMLIGMVTMRSAQTTWTMWHIE